MNTKIKLLGATILALGVSMGVAQAAPTFQSGSFSIGVQMDPTLNSYPANQFYGIQTNANQGAGVDPSTASSPSGDFASAFVPNDHGNVFFTNATGALDFNSADAGYLTTLGYSVNDAGTEGTFVATSVIGNGMTDAAGHVDYSVLGTWTVGSDFANQNTVANALTTWVFQLNGSVSGSGVLSASVPEPSTLSLFGVALLGFGFLQLKKKRKSAGLAS